MTTSLLWAMAVAIVSAGQAAPGTQDYFPPPESRGGWRTLVSASTVPSPEQRAALRERAGLDWASLLDAWTYCTGFSGPHSLLVIRHGWVRTLKEHPEFCLELFWRIMAAFDGPRASAKEAGPYGSGK